MNPIETEAKIRAMEVMLYEDKGASVRCAPAPCSVEQTHRSVIEHKLLAALDDESQVALLLTKQDLEDLIAALLEYEVKRVLPRWEPHKNRCKNLADGMRQLLREAFPPNKRVLVKTDTPQSEP